MLRKPFLFLLPLALLAGCQTKTVDELSYTEQKALAGQIVQRCKDQKVPQGEMQTCINAEAKREAATRYRSAQRQDATRASGRPRMCQVFGGSTVTCF